MAKKPDKPLRELRISIIRAKREYVGHVEAPDEACAIAQAMKEFKVDEAQRFRLIAQPMD
jgi:hypothetical protein